MFAYDGRTAVRGSAGRPSGGLGRPVPVLPAALAARARPISSASSRLLPLSEPLVSLFPDRALRRGSTVVVAGARGLGTTTLALALLAAPSAAGSWCGIVGVPDPGVVAMAELGIDLGRVVLVPEARGGWVDAVGELAGGIDVLLVRPFGSCRPGVARRLVARARERQTALVVLVDRPEEWPDGPDLTLRVTRAAWRGIGAGHGHLQCRLAEVEASGRRSAARSVSRRLWLPSSSGTVADGDGPEQPV